MAKFIRFSPIKITGATTNLAETLNKVQERIKASIDSILDASPVTNDVLTTITITATLVVYHNLGRALKSWEVVSQLGTGGLHQVPNVASVDPNLAVTLVPDGAGGVYTLRFC